MSTPATDFERTDTTEIDRARARSTRPRETDSVAGLFRRLADEVTDLFAQELALFKTETMGAIGDVRSAVGSLATGGAVLFAGFIFLLLAAFLGLANAVEPWLSALIVGGVTVIVGFIMVAAGKSKLEPTAFRPRHTEQSLRKDRDMVKGAYRHEQH
jgi:uncharacterized membrane protein YgdD (TMEM256/DUF423 family)